MNLFEIGNEVICWLDHNCVEIDKEHIDEARALIDECIDFAFSDYIYMRRDVDNE